MEEHSLAEAEIQVQILAGASCILQGGEAGRYRRILKLLLL